MLVETFLFVFPYLTLKCIKYLVNVIIVSSLVTDPPSESLYVRFLTMMVKDRLGASIVIESQKELIDLYYNYLKKNGGLDYVEDFVTPIDSVEGIRIDNRLEYPLTVRTNSITCENVLSLLGQVKNLSTLF